MLDIFTTMYRMQVLICAPDGEKLTGERDAVDLIGEALGSRAELILVPALSQFAKTAQTD